MIRIQRYSELPWNHDLWSLVRYYRSLRLRPAQSQLWLEKLALESRLPHLERKFVISGEVVDLLTHYIKDSAELQKMAINFLRTEEEAFDFCKQMKFPVGSTKTQNLSHHQSSKALIAAVSGIAKRVCKELGVPVDADPQRRALWFLDHGLHVSARNLDGAIPSLENPSAVWEIKEYWGKTNGGSKMSDAVYECHLVGLELRMFEAKCGFSINHIVFVDGKQQWDSRKSDLLRLIDLHQQGLIDHLVVGREVESDWPQLVKVAASKCLS